MPQEICPYPWCSLYQSITQLKLWNNLQLECITCLVYSVFYSVTVVQDPPYPPPYRLHSFIVKKITVLKQLYMLHPGIVQGWPYYREGCYKWLINNISKEIHQYNGFIVFLPTLTCAVEMFTGISLYMFRLQAVPLFSIPKWENNNRKTRNGMHKYQLERHIVLSVCVAFALPGFISFPFNYLNLFLFCERREKRKDCS